MWGGGARRGGPERRHSLHGQKAASLPDDVAPATATLRARDAKLRIELGRVAGLLLLLQDVKPAS